MQTLDRKLWRDLRQLWSQVLTIALVVASGVAGFLATFSAWDALSWSREIYYTEARFADVFIGLKRAPLALLPKVAALPGVAQVQDGVAHGIQVFIPGVQDPIRGRLTAIDPRTPQHLNQVTLRSGHWPSESIASGRLEVLVSAAFAQARSLKPGDHLQALMNGKLQALSVVGIALSPELEFVFRPVKAGPVNYSSHHDFVLAEAANFEAGCKAQEEGFAAVCIDTMSDSGVAALRAVLDIPVFGPGKTSVLTALMLGDRFSFLTMASRWKPLYKKALDELGLHHKCASVRAIEVPPDNQALLSGKEEDIFPLLEAAGRKAIEEDGAQVIEYSLIIAVVSIALVLALQGLDGGFAQFIQRVTDCLTGGACAVGGGGATAAGLVKSRSSSAGGIGFGVMSRPSFLLSCFPARAGACGCSPR